MYSHTNNSRGSPLTTVLILAGITLLAMLFGLVAVTTQPIFVGLAVGLIVGTMLMARPIWAIWLVLLLGLLVAGIVPIWAEGMAAKAVWGISLLGFLLMLRAWFNAATVPAATKNIPMFVWMVLVFLIYTCINTLFHWTSAYEALSGFKRYFQAAGLMFALAWLPCQEKDVMHWRRFFIIVALFQLPWAIYELVRLVPIREGLATAYPGLVPIDVVAGTFGANLTMGGANAEMATFLILIFAFLMAHLREKLIGFGRFALLLLPIIAPLFLGETKAVIIMLPLMFLTLYRREFLARPHYALTGLLACGILTAAAGYAYLEITKTTLEKQLAITLRYNIYEQGYAGYALNRTTVLTFWASHQGMHDPTGTVLGNGLGTAHDATGGSVSRRYPGYGIGLTAASTLLWEQGVAGTAIFLAILAFAWRTANQVWRAKDTPHWARADAAAIQAALPLFAFFLIYRSSLVEVMTFQIVFYSLLGHLAWLAKRFTYGRIA